MSEVGRALDGESAASSRGAERRARDGFRRLDPGASAGAPATAAPNPKRRRQQRLLAVVSLLLLLAIVQAVVRVRRALESLGEPGEARRAVAVVRS